MKKLKKQIKDAKKKWEKAQKAERKASRKESEMWWRYHQLKIKLDKIKKNEETSAPTNVSEVQILKEGTMPSKSGKATKKVAKKAVKKVAKKASKKVAKKAAKKTAKK